MHFSGDILEKGLAAYKHILEITRNSFNIIGSKEIIEEHFTDCLIAGDIFINQIKVLREKLGDKTHIYCVDLGSGAGLPGIPLSLLFLDRGIPFCKVLLLERTQKKVRFLQDAINHIESSIDKPLAVEVICRDLYEWKPEYNIHIVTARAFSPLNKRLLSRIKRIAPSATAFFYKGKKETLDKELQDTSSLFSVEKVYPFNVSGKERHILKGHCHHSVV